MMDLHLKLNEIITTQHIQSKQRATIHMLSNSLQRNTINDLYLHHHPVSNYERKLYQTKFQKKDLSEIFNIMFQKGTILLPDRNFLRRIMYDIFDEELIHSGSKDFVNHLCFKEYRAGETIECKGQASFYFVLKGIVQVHAGGFQYQRNQGQTFGELQIMSNQEIQSFLVKRSTLLFSLTKNNFIKFFKPFFLNKFEKTQQSLISIKLAYLQKVPKINKYHFLTQVQTLSVDIGQKITDKSHRVDNIYFLHEYKGNLLEYCLCSALGLNQMLKSKKYYQETVYSVDSEYVVPFVSVSVFKKYLLKCRNSSTGYNSTFFNKSSLQNPQFSRSKYMRVRKIRMAECSKVKTESSRIQTTFKFFKQPTETPPTKHTTPSIYLKLKNRLKSQKSSLKQPKIKL